jgi:arylsulfatase A-like enzyme
LYVIDTLRADRLGVYGYDQHTSPTIDELAASGVVFDSASAAAPWTLPSVSSLFLSQLSCEHGVTIDRDRIAADARPLALILKELGYETASFHANPYAGKMSGLDMGFDVARLVKQGALEDAVGAWLGARERDPFFLYVHTVEPHNPELALDRFIEPRGFVSEDLKREVEDAYRVYRTLTRVDYDAERPPGSTDNTDEQRVALARLDALRGPIDHLYDAMVREADERLGRIVASLESAGVWHNTVFILVSDHGEELGDRGGWQHDQSLYEELVDVPFVVRFPENAAAGRRIADPVGLIDVVPTLTEILGVEPPSSVRGRSLLPLIEGERALSTSRLSAVRHNEKKFYRPYEQTRGDLNVMMRRGQWKGIWNVELDTLELYDLDADPQERADVSKTEQAISEGMERFARSALEQCRERAPGSLSESDVELDEESRRQLESLGYVNRRKSP